MLFKNFGNHMFRIKFVQFNKHFFPYILAKQNFYNQNSFVCVNDKVSICHLGEGHFPLYLIVLLGFLFKSVCFIFFANVLYSCNVWH